VDAAERHRSETAEPPPPASATTQRLAAPGVAKVLPGPVANAGWMRRLSSGQLVALVIVFGLLLYLPFAGSYGLWDPWETHYAEVARQMTERGDLISLWWPGSARERPEFWSKPVLTFWLMSAAMRLGGMGLAGAPSDEMAVGSGVEWLVRLPSCLFGVLAMCGTYLIVARLVGRRAGLLSAVVLATSPMFSLIARQAMTDMILVGPMTMALALGVLAIADEDGQALPRGRMAGMSWPRHASFYAILAALALLVLPQLIVISVQLRGAGFWSAGPVAMAPYTLALAASVILVSRLRYRRPLYLVLCAICCGLALLAKGVVGVVLPALVLGGWLAFSGGWRELRRAELLPGLALAALVLVVVAAPWHHAMAVRHGLEWWKELYGDNHWTRMLVGRHGQRGTFEYYLLQLGYALLPWAAVAPAAFTHAVMCKGEPPGRQAVYRLGALWFVTAYALASLAVTKFHHYILPALPGLAIVVGCFLDQIYQDADARKGRLIVLVGLPLFALVLHDLLSSQSAARAVIWLFSYDYVLGRRAGEWPDQLDFRRPLLLLGALGAATTCALAFRRLVRPGIVGLTTAAVLFTYFLLDVYMVRVTPYWSLKDAIGEYYKQRRSPEEKLVAYLMFWRGETFYTKNEIHEGPAVERTVFDRGSHDQDPGSDAEDPDHKLVSWMERHAGRRVFFLFEYQRADHLQSLLPAGARDTFRIIHERNKKFSLACADL
jgi:4-amino-4-deoxy-L-arabinose transferase-like glycosyltransferase